MRLKKLVHINKRVKKISSLESLCNAHALFKSALGTCVCGCECLLLTTAETSSNCPSCWGWSCLDILSPWWDYTCWLVLHVHHLHHPKLEWKNPDENAKNAFWVTLNSGWPLLHFVMIVNDCSIGTERTCVLCTPTVDSTAVPQPSGHHKCSSYDLNSWSASKWVPLTRVSLSFPQHEHGWLMQLRLLIFRIKHTYRLASKKKKTILLTISLRLADLELYIEA